MSKPTLMKKRWWMAGVAALVIAALTGWRDHVPSQAGGVSRGSPALLTFAVWVPGGDYSAGSREPGCTPPRKVTLAGFYIWPTEVTRAMWAEFRGAASPDGFPNAPAASLSYIDAEAFCRWFSDRHHMVARLPTVDEWEVAARAGKAGVTYSSGWSDPVGRVVFRADAAEGVTSRKPNRWGLHHMSGNVAEWCRAEAGEGDAPVMGGSWAERDPRFVRISHVLRLPKDYRDEDVGFRFVIEAPTPNESIANRGEIQEY